MRRLGDFKRNLLNTIRYQKLLD